MGILEIVRMQDRRDGEAKGRLEGKLEGELKKALAIAREMKKDKFSVETIAKLTKLSISEIESL